MSTTYQHPTNTGTKFRAAVAESQSLQVVGITTAYAIKVAGQIDFRAAYLSGGDVAANLLGTPDLDISTMEDVLIDARHITDAMQIPLMVDIGIGRGGAFNTARTIRSFIRADVAAIHLEGQVGQKYCGYCPGRKIVSTDEMVGHVKAAVDVRTDDDFVIVAHTDAAASEGINAAIERAVAYVEAGADVISPETTKTLDDYCRFEAVVGVSTLANPTEFGSTPLFTTDELHNVSVDVALYCCGAYRVTDVAALNFYQIVMHDGTQKAAMETIQSRTNLHQYLSYHACGDKLDALFTAQK